MATTATGMGDPAASIARAGLPSAGTSHPGDKDVSALQLTLVLYAAMFAAKLVIYFVTGVMALLAEALHTMSDIFISGFLLLALFYSRRRADEEHMFGHGRAQSIAGLAAAVLFISFTAYKLYEEAVPRLFKPETGGYTNLWLAVGVLAASMLVAAVPFVRLLRARTRGAAARAQLLELVNDELGLAAAMVGTLLLMSGITLADPIASIVVATVIAINGINLFRENFSVLLGRAPKPEFMEHVREAALSVPGVVGVNGILAEVVGPDAVHAGIRLALPPQMPVSEAARVVAKVRERVHQDSAGTGYCVIQVEPAASDGGQSPAAAG